MRTITVSMVDGVITPDEPLPFGVAAISFDGEKYTVYESRDEVPPVHAPGPYAPQVVTMRQARLALHHAGRLTEVDTAIDAMAEPQKSAARIEWDHAHEVHRSSAMVAMIGEALGLDASGLDALFTDAAAR